MSFIEKHSILSPTQYGFCPESSTEFAILDIVSSFYENINNKLFTGLIMIDLKKAFDSVTHLAAKTITLRFSWQCFQFVFFLIFQIDNNM